MRSDWRVRVFDAGAGLYGFLTASDVWQRVNGELVAHFPAGTAQVCDLGCGTGATAIAEARACPAAQVVGVDISPAMIARAERAVAACPTDVRDRISVHVGDATRLPFADGRFDVVTGHSFLYLVPQRASVLREVARVLRPGGRAIFMEPRRGDFSPVALLRVGRDPRFLVSMTLWRIAARANVRFTEASLSELLGAAGLSPARTEVVLGGLGVVGVAERRDASAPRDRA